MSGETAKWTVDTLRELFLAQMSEMDKRNEQRFLAQQKAVQDALIAQEKAVTAALAASEKAVLVAEATAEKWRQNANEWRGSMNDRERNFAMRSDLVALKERIDRTDGKGAGLNAGWGYIVGAAGFVAAVVSVIAMVVK